MVKVVKPDFVDPNNFTEAHFLNFDEFCHIPFVLPEALGPDFPRPIIEVEEPRAPVDYFEVGSMPIVSTSMKQVLIDSGADIEFIEVQVFEKNERPYKGDPLFFAHLLKEIDCFDYTNSVYEKRRDFVSQVNRLVLLTDRIGREPVFRIANVAIPDWIANDSMVEHVRASQLRGMIFLDPDEYLRRFG